MPEITLKLEPNIELNNVTLSAAKVAKLLSVSRVTIVNWCNDRKTFPNAFKKNPGRVTSAWVIPLTDITAFLERRNPTAPPVEEVKESVD